MTDTVHRLAAQGLVEYEPYKPVTLTPRGTEYAIAMVRRHRLIETFLVDTLGYGWGEVHDEAERLEHAVSNVLIDRIDDLLGGPSTDPHGDPIPDRNGRTTTPRNAVRLSAAQPGNYRIVRVSDADPNHLARAETVGLVPGALISVATSGSGPPVDLAEGVWLLPA